MLESLKAATTGPAKMPFPLGCFEVYSQFVSGARPIDWLLNSMKVSFSLGCTAEPLRQLPLLFSVATGSVHFQATLSVTRVARRDHVKSLCLM